MSEQLRDYYEEIDQRRAENLESLRDDRESELTDLRRQLADARAVIRHAECCAKSPDYLNERRRVNTKKWQRAENSKRLNGTLFD